LLVAAGAARPRSLASVDDPNLVIDTIKKAEDSQDLIVRLYECHGARGTARLRLDRPFEAATFCNILEDELGPAKIGRGLIQVPYGPFQIITLKVRP
jgi:alpha-mannosidase